MGTVQSQAQGTDFQADFPSQTQTRYSETGQASGQTEERTQVFPVQSQVVRQTTVVPVHVVQGTGSQSRSSEISGWVFITILRVISAVLCTGVLIAAAIAVSAINEVADLYVEQGNEYDNASSYRGAAGWLVFVGCAALIFHVVMIAIQILYFKCSTNKHFKHYMLINTIFCILFVLALLAGGIPNAIYAAENSDLWTDECFFVFGFDGDEFCESLERVRDAEIASTVLSMFSMMFLLFFFCVSLGIGLASAKATVPHNQHFSSQPQSAAPYPPTHVTTYVQPSVPPSAPPLAQKSVQPTAPPSYASVYPPSYDSVTAPAYNAYT